VSVAKENSSRLLLLILLALCVSNVNAVEDVDLLLINGNIYTVNDKQPHAEAVAVKDKRIVFVGANDEAKKFRAARVLDLAGKTIVPGLTDSHCHIFGIGERELRLNLEGLNTRENFLAKLKQRAGQTEKGNWVVGRGWIETFWIPPTFPTRDELDKIAPDNPVFLTRADGHASVVNSAALKLAGVDERTKDPFGGQILKNNNRPNGMLLDNAQDLVEKIIPPATPAERDQAFLTGVEREMRLGWCEIQNAGSHYDEIALMRKQFEAGKVKIRLVNCVFGPGADAERFLGEGAAIGLYDQHFTERTIKVVFDGALGSRGAALLKPYSDVNATTPSPSSPEQPASSRRDESVASTSGYLTEKPEQLQRMFEEALRRGIQVETHAIGDRANRIILDLYAQAFKTVPPNERARSVRGRSSATPASAPGPQELAPPSAAPAGGDVRWRVEHAQILSPADIPRFARLGVIASMQPSHAISDLFFAPARLGLERLKGAYAWQSLIKSGAIICGGSDAPVERGEPMIEFYAAVSRKSIKGESGVGWHPEQAVSREDALRMFTTNAAYAAFEENDKGSIEVDKLADFTVLSGDIMKVPSPEILKTRCEMTIIGGEIVFQAGP
jgi:predicted amidohydrolase YtcJ